MRSLRWKNFPSLTMRPLSSTRPACISRWSSQNSSIRNSSGSVSSVFSSELWPAETFLLPPRRYLLASSGPSRSRLHSCRVSDRSQPEILKLASGVVSSAVALDAGFVRSGWATIKLEHSNKNLRWCSPTEKKPECCSNLSEKEGEAQYFKYLKAITKVCAKHRIRMYWTIDASAIFYCRRIPLQFCPPLAGYSAL